MGLDAAKVAEYLSGSARIIAQLPAEQIKEFVDVLLEARAAGRQVFVVGNGGSAATSSHFMCDINKVATDPRWMKGVKKFKVIALTDNVPLITAWGNDQDYADVFAEQLDNFMQAGDVLLAISASGNSENIIRAVGRANEKGGVTLGLAGFGGGRLKETARRCIVVPSSHYGEVEDAHHVICHAFTYCMMNHLRQTQGEQETPGNDGE